MCDWFILAFLFLKFNVIVQMNVAIIEFRNLIETVENKIYIS